MGRHGMYLPTVAWLISIPSLSSSPWMRGAPQSGLARHIWRIKSRVAVHIFGRPGDGTVIANASRAESPCDATG